MVRGIQETGAYSSARRRGGQLEAGATQLEKDAMRGPDPGDDRARDC